MGLSTSYSIKSLPTITKAVFSVVLSLMRARVGGPRVENLITTGTPLMQWEIISRSAFFDQYINGVALCSWYGRA